MRKERKGNKVDCIMKIFDGGAPTGIQIRGA